MTTIVVFDTESTGLPPRSRPIHDMDAWGRCRIVQMAWAVYAHTGELLAAKCFTVRPDGFVVPASATAIHGISHVEAVQSGVPIGDALRAFTSDLSRWRVDTLVAHNIAFDHPLVASEMFRAGLPMHTFENFNIMCRYCTMMTGTKPGGKWPRLGELYFEFFQKPMIGGHKADQDVDACAQIYFAQMNAKGRRLEQ